MLPRFCCIRVCALLICLLVTQLFAQPLQWTPSGVLHNPTIAQFAASPTGELFFATWEGDLYKRSADGLVVTNMHHTGVPAAMVVAPNGRLFASIGISLLVSNVSNDSLLSTNFQTFRVCSQLAVTSQALFALSNNPPRLYRSFDFGATWDSVTVPANNQLASSPNGILYVIRSDSVYRSTNNGTAWSASNTGLPVNVNIHCIAISPLTNNVFLGTHAHGIYRSASDGLSWSRDFQELSAIDISQIAVDISNDLCVGEWGQNPNIYYFDWRNQVWRLGLQRVLAKKIEFLSPQQPVFDTPMGGLFTSTNRGISWSVIGTSGPICGLFAFGDTVFAANSLQFRSTNRGENWFLSHAGLYDTNHTFERRPILRANDGNFLRGCKYGVYRSTDLGRSWDTTASSYNWYDFEYTCLGGNDGSIVLTGSYNPQEFGYGKIHRSTNHGASWQAILTTGETPNVILWHSNQTWLVALDNTLRRSTDNAVHFSTIATSPPTSIRAMVKTSTGIVYAGTGAGVYRSTNTGDTWQACGIASLSTVVLSLLVLPNDHLLAGTLGQGVFYSNDHGETWSSIAGGLTNETVRILVRSDNGSIFAGTNNGVFRCDNFLNTVEPNSDLSLPKSATLLPTFPNPFNATTTIRYALPEASAVTLDVVDILGRTVAQLVRQSQPAGEHTIQFSGEQIASGIYFLRLQSGSNTITQKIVLLR